MTNEEYAERLAAIISAPIAEEEDMIRALAQESGYGLGVVRRAVSRARREAREAGLLNEGPPRPDWADPELGREATHSELGIELLRLTGNPVWCGDDFWALERETQLWVPIGAASMHAEAARYFGSQDGARFFTNTEKANDIRGIVAMAEKIADDQKFFWQAVLGVPCASRFYKVEGREIVEAELTGDDRQRWRMDVDPTPGKPEMLLKALERHLGHDPEQVGSLQEAFGAALFGLLPSFKKVIMLKGPKDCGKSTLLGMLAAMVPPGAVTAVPASKLDDPTYLISMMHARLNIDADLDPHKLIAESVLRQLTGGDPITIRGAYRRDAVTFICTTSMGYGCNELVTSRDRSSSFYERWLLYELARPLEAHEQRPGWIVRLLAKEKGQILAWLIEGARRVLHRGHFVDTPTSLDLRTQWQGLNDNVHAFMMDRDEITITGEAAHKVPGPVLYSRYQQHAKDNGTLPLGRNRFYATLKDQKWWRLGVRLQHGERANTEAVGLMLSGATERRAAALEARKGLGVVGGGKAEEPMDGEK